MDMSNTGIKTRPACCPEHGDFESRSVAIMGKMFHWSGCPECNRIDEERKAAEKRRADEADRQRRIEARLNRAGIPLRFRSKKFDRFMANEPGQQEAFYHAVAFANDFVARANEGATMVFAGKPGTGKSHLAIAICLQIMDVGCTAMYLNALDAVRMVRATWRRDSEITEHSIMDTLAGVDLLVIDEVGAQYGTEGEQVILFDVINRRYQDQQPMILLTNQSKEKFREFIGDRAYDRLREAGKWVAFDWDSHRGNRQP